MVNKYIDSYMNGTNYYAKFIDSVPSFVTYYSRDVNESMENAGIGAVKEVVGYESPNRYNKVDNMPLYGVEEITPDMVYDGISGINTEAELTAIVIPDTLIPNVDDLVLFSYHETNDNNQYRLYRITDIDLSNIDSNSYYRISLVSTSYDIEVLNSHQIIDDYKLVYNNIGTDEKTVLLEDDFIRVAKLEELFDIIIENYINNFFDSQLGSFLYHDPLAGIISYSSDLHEFLERHSDLLISSKSFMKNIKIINYTADRYNHIRKPINLYYKYMEDIERYGNIHRPLKFEVYKHIMYRMTRIRNSTFDILPKKYLDLDRRIFLDEESMKNFFDNVNITDNEPTQLIDHGMVVYTSSLIDISSELELIIAKEINVDIDDTEAINNFYTDISNTEYINSLLYQAVSDKYFVHDDDTEINLDDTSEDNQLPYILSFIIKNIHLNDVNNIYDDNINVWIKYIKNNIQDIDDYNYNNYLYTPILLYFIKESINYLINN